MKIGIFDSGLGGLSALKTFVEFRAGTEILYFGDIQNSPYGEKSVTEVYDLSKKACQYLLDLGSRAILIACNTATSASVKKLRENFSFPIFGMEPAVKPALAESDTHKTVVFATSLTLKEEKFSNLVRNLNGEDKIIPMPCDGLSGLIDAGRLGDASAYLKRIAEQKVIPENCSLVLGCTHYVLIKELFEQIFPNRRIYDGNKGTVMHIINSIGISQDGNTEFSIHINGGNEENQKAMNNYLRGARVYERIPAG